MNYYKAKIGFDDGKNLLVKNELITEKEKEKYYKNFKAELFELVEISKKDTYIFFGTRFEGGN